MKIKFCSDIGENPIKMIRWLYSNLTYVCIHKKLKFYLPVTCITEPP